MSESNPVGLSAAPSSSTSLANRQVAATPESERLAEALGKLESAAPPDAYWYMDDRNGIFDRLVDWQARRKDAGKVDGGSADSTPLLANRMGVLMAGFAVVFVTIGAIYGMRSHFNREFGAASANSLPSNVPSLPQRGVEIQPPGVSLVVDPESESLLAGAPTVSVTEFEDPFLGLAAQEAANFSESAFNTAAPGGVPGTSPAPAAGKVPVTSENETATTEGNAAAPGGEVVVIYAPPARERRMPERQAARAPDGETDRARPVQIQIQTRAPETSVRSRRSARARASESLARKSTMDRDDERRIDRQADRAFQAEYRREFDRVRRNRNDWRPSPTSAVDPRNPNWGWD